MPTQKHYALCIINYALTLLLVLLSSVYVKLSKNSFLYASMPKIWPKADAKVLQIFKPRKLFRNFFLEEYHFFEFVYKRISFIHYNIYAYERNCQIYTLKMMDEYAYYSPSYPPSINLVGSGRCQPFSRPLPLLAAAAANNVPDRCKQKRGVLPPARYVLHSCMVHPLSLFQRTSFVASKFLFCAEAASFVFHWLLFKE